MHSETDVARIVRSWLRTDEHESADRVLDDVLALLDATPQRRPVWPARRIADMNTYAKLLVAAVAVAVVAVVGITLLPAGGVGGPPVVASPSPSPAAIPPASPAAIQIATFPPSGALAVGRHGITQEGVRYTFEVSNPGWISNGSFAIDKEGGVSPEGAGFIVWGDTPVGVFADPCRGVKGPPIGASADRLAAAVASLPGTDLVSGPSDVTVGGHLAKQVVIIVRDDIGCGPGSFYMWYAPTPELARFATALGSKIRVWIIDVNGQLIWIDGETFKGSGPGPGQDVQQLVDSIQFE